MYSFIHSFIKDQRRHCNIFYFSWRSLAPTSPRRLQQDVQSVSGQRAASQNGPAPPPALHPHRCGTVPTPRDSSVPNPTVGTEQLERAGFSSVVVVTPNSQPCVISVCRLLRPGVSAGLLPPLCQQQAAGDALSLPLPFRWAEEAFFVVVAVQTGSELCVLSIRSIFLFLSGFITCKFHSNDIFPSTANAPEMRKVFFFFLVSSALLHFIFLFFFKVCAKKTQK